MPQNVPLLTIASIEPKVTRQNKKPTPRYEFCFQMTYEQWRAFFNHHEHDVYSGWGNQLMPHLKQLNITCTIIFRYHKVRGKYSRKRNTNLFNGVGRCKAELCPVTLSVHVEDEPKKNAVHTSSKWWSMAIKITMQNRKLSHVQ